jgi:hypothetical protein
MLRECRVGQGCSFCIPEQVVALLVEDGVGDGGGGVEAGEEELGEGGGVRQGLGMEEAVVDGLPRGGAVSERGRDERRSSQESSQVVAYRGGEERMIEDRERQSSEAGRHLPYKTSAPRQHGAV